jgi:hypothetical protein
MRSLLEKKPLVLLLSIFALGALVILSVSLREVSFAEAQPIGREEAEESAGLPPGVFTEVKEVTLQSQIILIFAFAILVALVFVLLSKEGRKRLFIFLFRMGFTIFALYLLSKRYPGMLSFLDTGLTGEGPRQDTLQPGANIPPPVFTPPQETPLLNYAVSLLIVLGVAFVVWRAYRMWRAMNQRPVNSLKDLARIARSSLRELSDGRESTDVILNCYFRMGDAVSDKKNLQRGIGMTPAEFASRLEEAGLPGDAVRRLTRLFESVRYGAHKAGPREVNEAVACLTTILQYCGEPV